MSLFIDFMRPQIAEAKCFSSFAVCSITNDIGAIVKIYCDTMQQAQAMADAFNNPGRVTALEGFIGDFAAADFEAIGRIGYVHPEDEQDDVTDLGYVEAWQQDARDMLKTEPAPQEAAE